MTSLLKSALALTLVISLGACASSYHARAQSAHNAYFRGDYGRALELIEKVKPARRDRLLYLLDKGMILHAAGEYEESNRVLEQAEDLGEQLYAKSITRETAATLWSEEARDYPGERHELAMIPTIRMLNYIMLDEWDEALVEVRRLGNTVEKVYGTEHEFSNAFSIYLSALIWEAMGQINDALIDYKRLARQDARVPYYGNDLRATSRRLAMPVKLPQEGSIAWRKSPRYREKPGELIVIAAAGRSPGFESDWVSTGYFTVSMPTIVTYGSEPSNAKVLVDGKEAGTTYPFYNIAQDIMVALKERAKRSLVRKMVKLSVQTGLYAGGAILMESDEVEHQLAGLAMSILALSMAATDKADERSWRTLPANFQIGRFYLEPGPHEVEVVPEGGGTPIRQSITVSRDRPSVTLARFGGSWTTASREETAGEAQVSKAREKEIAREVRLNPGDGDLKLKLARARIEGGQYDVESLVRRGMDQGGSKHEGTFLMTAASTLRKRYPDALEWARRGVKEGSGSHYAYYVKSLEYISGNRANPPKAEGPELTDEETLENAFNHYMVGLVHERSGDNDDATDDFARAYECGLRGETVLERIVGNYKLTDEFYKKSEKGVDTITDFADSFVDNI